MAATGLVECSFFIPLVRDANLADGAAHLQEAWDWLDNELYDRFAGSTTAPGEYHGYYQDPDTGQKVGDRSYRFIVAIPKRDIDRLPEVLAGACVMFAQKCIYLSVAGKVEYIEAKDGA